MTVKVSIADCRAGAEPKVFGGEGSGNVARVNVASNETLKDATGKDTKETTWLPVVAYGAAARFLAANVHKGTPLQVDGELRNRTYDQEGQKHTVAEVHVIPGRGTVKLLDSKPGAAEVGEAIGERQKQAMDPAHTQ